LQVSVIIPCFNADRWITKVLDSCLMQGPLLGEVVVVDDGSTDDSTIIVQRYVQEHPDRIRLLRNPGKGGNAARVFGFTQSRFDLIQWLDADDYLCEGKFSAQVRHLQGNVDIVYSDWIERFHNNDDRIVRDVERIMNSDESLLLSLAADRWSVPANYLMTRGLAERTVAADGWMPGRRIAQDREFFTIAAVLSRRAAYVPGLFSIYNRRPHGSVSGMDFAERLSLQMPLDARLRAFVLDADLCTGEKPLCMRRLNTHCINAVFYNWGVMPQFFFWPWQVSLSLLHWKKRVIYPLLYFAAMVGYCRYRLRLDGVSGTMQRNRSDDRS